VFNNLPNISREQLEAFVSRGLMPPKAHELDTILDGLTDENPHLCDFVIATGESAIHGALPLLQLNDGEAYRELRTFTIWGIVLVLDLLNEALKEV